MTSNRRKYLAEMFGTFCLVFCGTGAITVNQVTGGQVTGLGIGLVFGLIVLAMIYAVGHISGAHLNPAVTLGFYAAGRHPARQIVPYVAGQIAGALAASLTIRFIFPGGHTDFGVTMPSGPWLQSFLIEFILTMILMFVILRVATGDRAEGILAGVAIGSIIALEAIWGGPISGASMNPARSLAPAIASGVYLHHWIYWVAPIGGSVSAAWVNRYLNPINDAA